MGPVPILLTLWAIQIKSSKIHIRSLISQVANLTQGALQSCVNTQYVTLFPEGLVIPNYRVQHVFKGR